MNEIGIHNTLIYDEHMCSRLGNDTCSVAAMAAGVAGNSRAAIARLMGDLKELTMNPCEVNNPLRHASTAFACGQQFLNIHILYYKPT